MRLIRRFLGNGPVVILIAQVAAFMGDLPAAVKPYHHYNLLGPGDLQIQCLIDDMEIIRFSSAHGGRVLVRQSTLLLSVGHCSMDQVISTLAE